MKIDILETNNKNNNNNNHQNNNNNINVIYTVNHLSYVCLLTATRGNNFNFIYLESTKNHPYGISVALYMNFTVSMNTIIINYIRESHI